MSRGSGWRRSLDRGVARLVYLVVLSVCLLVLVELAVRLVAGDPAQDFYRNRLSSDAYSHFEWRDAYFRDLAAGADFRALSYEPFSLWKHRDFESETINVAGGYRSTWEPPPAPGQEDVELLVFGGSTLFGGEGPDEHTIPSYLARGLERAPARYLVRNHGVSGFASDNEVHLLVRLLGRGRRPRAAIFYDGANETYNKVALGQPHYLYENFHHLGQYSLRGALARVARRSRLVQLLAPNGTKVRDLETDPAELARRAGSMLDDYLANVRFVRSLAAAHGFDAYFFWQPTLFDTGKALTPEERRHLEQQADLAPAYSAVRELIDRRDLLRTAGVHDLEGAVDPIRESVFLDYCHVTALANQALASAMLPRVENSLVGVQHAASDRPPGVPLLDQTSPRGP